MSTELKHTPGPWVAHGAFYAHGVKGDVFAKDAANVFDATPVCRVVAPVSHRQEKKSKSMDAIHAIGKRKQQAPVIEANARLIAAAPELLSALTDALEALAMCRPCTDHGARCQSEAMLKAHAAIAKAGA